MARRNTLSEIKGFNKNQRFAPAGSIEFAFLDIDHEENLDGTINSIKIVSEDEGGKQYRFNLDALDCLFLVACLGDAIAAGDIDNEEIEDAIERVGSDLKDGLSMRDIMAYNHNKGWVAETLTTQQLAECSLVAEIATKDETNRIPTYILKALIDTYWCCHHRDEDYVRRCTYSYLALIRGTTQLSFR